MNITEFLKERNITDSDFMETGMTSYIIDLVNEYEAVKAKLILPVVMCSLDFQEIENLVRLKHYEDSDYGNNKERCKELLEESRNEVGYTLEDFENYT